LISKPISWSGKREAGSRFRDTINGILGEGLEIDEAAKRRLEMMRPELMKSAGVLD
jgi:hypothetical protein